MKMMDGGSRGIMLKVAICLVIFLSVEDMPAEGADCISNLKNLAVYEGDKNILMDLTADPNNVNWKIVTTSDELRNYTITDYGGYRNPDFVDLFYPNQSGLVILNSTTRPFEKLIPTSGLYIAQCTNSTSRMAAKLVVVRKAPECSCYTNSSSTSVQLTSTIYYADGSIHPINARMTWMMGGVVYAEDTPVRKRIQYVVFESTSTITVDIGIARNFVCIVTFNAPTDFQCGFIATNAPQYTASCTVDACYPPSTSSTPATTISMSSPPTASTTTTQLPTANTTTTPLQSANSTTPLPNITTTAQLSTANTTAPLPNTSTSTQLPNATVLQPTETTQRLSTTSQLPKRTTPHPTTSRSPTNTNQSSASATENFTNTQPSTTTSSFDQPTLSTKRYTKELSTTTQPPRCNCPLIPSCPPTDDNCNKTIECQPDGTIMTIGLYREVVVKAQLYVRYEKCCPKNLVWGVVVTLRIGSRWLIHDPLCHSDKCQMIIIDASCMSSEWNLLSDRNVAISTAGDYVQTGNSVQTGSNTSDCSESCRRMTNLP